jgi:hypothetical protein
LVLYTSLTILLAADKEIHLLCSTNNYLVFSVFGRQANHLRLISPTTCRISRNESQVDTFGQVVLRKTLLDTLAHTFRISCLLLLSTKRVAASLTRHIGADLLTSSPAFGFLTPPKQERSFCRKISLLSKSFVTLLFIAVIEILHIKLDTVESWRPSLVVSHCLTNTFAAFRGPLLHYDKVCKKRTISTFNCLDDGWPSFGR